MTSENDKTIGLRSALIKWGVRLGILPADFLLLYNPDSYEWVSGFGNYAVFMYGLVRCTKPNAIVEIGSAHGKSTCFIAAALQRNNHGILYSIDPHLPTDWNDGNPLDDTYRIVRDRLKELHLLRYVEQIKQYSSEAIKRWCKPIDILLLDGSHTFEDVENDFYGFQKFIEQAGLIVFHDTMWDYYRDNPHYRTDQGVPKFVQKLIDDGYPTVTLREGWGLTILQNSMHGFKLLPD